MGFITIFNYTYKNHYFNLYSLLKCKIYSFTKSLKPTVHSIICTYTFQTLKRYMWGNTTLDDHRGKNSSHSNKSLGYQSTLCYSDCGAQWKQPKLFGELSKRHFSHHHTEGIT